MTKCLTCSKETTNPKFCNRSCAAINSNKFRSKESRQKQAVSVKKTFARNPKLFNADPVYVRPDGKARRRRRKGLRYPFSWIFKSVCKYSGKIWYSQRPMNIHPSYVETGRQYRYQCRFMFSISKYPEWFSYASNMIKTYGWYAAKNRGDNPTGCSRDHMVSVAYGFENGIDPKIISHPANCEIIPFQKNARKRTDCSITIDELMERIRLFNELYMEDRVGIGPTSTGLQPVA